MRWYVVHTHAGAEPKARFHLLNQGFQVYLPQYLKMRRHARRTERVKSPLFPRYLFVRMDVKQSRWRAVNSTFGVSHLICRNDEPISVSDELVAAIREREDASGAVRINKLLPMRMGDKIRFVSGPLAEHVGIFECETDHDRVVVLLDLLGRPMRVTVQDDAIMSYA